jgi:hypothetical protein
LPNILIELEELEFVLGVNFDFENGFCSTGKSGGGNIGGKRCAGGGGGSGAFGGNCRCAGNFRCVSIAYSRNALAYTSAQRADGTALKWYKCVKLKSVGYAVTTAVGTASGGIVAISICCFALRRAAITDSRAFVRPFMRTSG